ncbi:hypothetical protein DESC_60010 [Desulfosarcina cetonica]|nr:hypothetical protein DESC_60010 [Desulfosarcina cetonica]
MSVFVRQVEKGLLMMLHPMAGPLTRATRHGPDSRRGF